MIEVLESALQKAAGEGMDEFIHQNENSVAYTFWI